MHKAERELLEATRKLVEKVEPLIAFQETLRAKLERRWQKAEKWYRGRGKGRWISVSYLSPKNAWFEEPCRVLDYFPENLDGSDKVLENLEKIKKRLEKDELPDELQELIDNYLRTFENVYVTDNLVDFESYCANFTPPCAVRFPFPRRPAPTIS